MRATWMFTTGLGLLGWGLVQVGGALAQDPPAGQDLALGAAMLLGACVLLPLGVLRLRQLRPV